MTRHVLLWMIPINLFLVGWVWIGRSVFGVGGWMVLIYLYTVVPVLLIGLLGSTILAYTKPGRPRDLTRPQATAQLATWAGMVVFGAVSADFGDTDDSAMSLLTRLFGDNQAAWAATTTLMVLSGLATVCAWIALMVTLSSTRRRPPVGSRT